LSAREKLPLRISRSQEEKKKHVIAGCHKGAKEGVQKTGKKEREKTTKSVSQFRGPLSCEYKKNLKGGKLWQEGPQNRRGSILPPGKAVHKTRRVVWGHEKGDRFWMEGRSVERKRFTLHHRRKITLRTIVKGRGVASREKKGSTSFFQRKARPRRSCPRLGEEDSGGKTKAPRRRGAFGSDRKKKRVRHCDAQ